MLISDDGKPKIRHMIGTDGLPKTPIVVVHDGQECIWTTTGEVCQIKEPFPLEEFQNRVAK